MLKYIITISLGIFLAACSESFTDTRDGQSYSIVKIGNQTWMAENLNFKAEGSFCPDGDARNCKRLGALYSFDVAKNVCPEGFRLPSKEDFGELLNNAGGIEFAGAVLKSTSGWYKKGNGNDSLDFNALPAGFMNRSGKFDGIGGYAQFWSSSTDESESSFAYYLELDFSVNRATLKTFDQGDARSIRCVRN